ncbi:lipoyl(octanoyl) transferase LipB [Cumulibacter soli]|uniref:lipoyl(octanoyl) transferase LipB n=1 Tax=Cumulibacter soli TaxID=2546344 RepID=UPI001FBB44B0|nr:lipoyl(octanoyl) transferase LipB [Cumulibacter soli]
MTTLEASSVIAPLEFEYLDLSEGRLVEYQWAWDYQREIHAKVAAEEAPGRVLLLEHAPVYTAGRRTKPEDMPFDGTPVIQVDRGGEITWHGPGQLVGYPIIKLPARIGVVDHVRRMESAIIAVLAEYGIVGGRVQARTGVWLDASDARPVTARADSLWDADRTRRPVSGDPIGVIGDAAETSGRGSTRADSGTSGTTNGGGSNISFPSDLANVLAVPARPERKISAIGIRVSKRTTMHGFAININDSTAAAFSNIVPCGISDAGVTSMAAELPAAPPLMEVAQRIEPHLRRCLDYSRPTADILAED